MEPNKLYLVQWTIEVAAPSPLEAAREALNIQRDRESLATVFDVIEFDGNGEAERIDLLEE